MEENKVYEIDVAYNPKLLDWLKQFHVQISTDQKGITIRVPFSNPKDLHYAKNLLEDALVEKTIAKRRSTLFL